MNRTYSTLSIDVADVAVTVHCVHDDETITFRVEHVGEHITVYLHGTLNDLARFASAVAKTCAAYAIAEVERASVEAAQ